MCKIWFLTHLKKHLNFWNINWSFGFNIYSTCGNKSRLYNTPNMALYILDTFLHYTQQKWDQGTLGHKGWPWLGPGPALVLQWTLPWPYNNPDMTLYILARFLHSMQPKWDQRTLGTQIMTLIGSMIRLGPSMDPAMALQYIQHGTLYRVSHRTVNALLF